MNLLQLLLVKAQQETITEEEKLQLIQILDNSCQEILLDSKDHYVAVCPGAVKKGSLIFD